MKTIRILIKFWHHPDRRPLWQIAGYALLYPVYLAARALVDWFDGL